MGETQAHGVDPPLRDGDERPVRIPTGRRPEWASDVIALMLRDLGVEYIALNPGSSYRGLHDSLVNYLGNQRPQLLLCLHEEHAVAIAHGYAKASERPMGVALHSNVGLMHGSMAIFNAFCDRVPMLILGATGPLDAVRRRPWIDWLHTAADQAALIRPFIKWDDQPLSLAAAVDALFQAHMLTTSAPTAPTYVSFDASSLEAQISGSFHNRASQHFSPAIPCQPDEDTVARMATLLQEATRPVMLVGRTSRSERAWQERIELAERVDAQVFTHLKLPAAFPTRHPLHHPAPATFTSPALRDALSTADVVLALDWLDLGGTLAASEGGSARTITVTRDDQLHSGWGKESFNPVPAELRASADVDPTVRALLRHIPPRSGARSDLPRGPRAKRLSQPRPDGRLVVDDIAAALDQAAGTLSVTLARVPNNWSGGLWAVEHPLDMLGADGGEGIGSGPGMVIGTALALQGSGRLVVGVLGDGDYLMGVNALWTAAHYRVGMLLIVANNQSFFNDEIHQHQVALRRGRPAENRWIGQRISDPEVDLTALAVAQGLTAFGPVEDNASLSDALGAAVSEARAGQSVVVDVRILSSVEGETARAATTGGRG